MGDDDSDRAAAWPPVAFARQLQDAGEEAVDQQRRMYERMLSGGTAGFPGLESMSLSTATFKARVQSGGRVSIPDAEREALDIEEGDLVQTIVIPLRKNNE